MNVPAKLAAFGVAAVAAGLLGAGIGELAGPIGTEPEPHTDPAHEAPAETGGHGDEHEPAPADEPEGEVGGLAVSDQGFRLDLLTPTVAAGAEAELALQVLDADGHPVTAVDEVHERPLHLIVVGRDLVDYHHVHPTLDADGTWRVEVPDLAPGSHRVVADLQPTGGPELALGTDLAVTGDPSPTALPEPSRTATDADGVTTELAGDLAVGEHDLTFTVRAGADVVTPDPYLGARGHLVAIRQGDMAYLHVHPHEGDGPEVAFTASFPSPGTYRLFLDVSLGGEVRTAAFTVVIPEGS